MRLLWADARRLGSRPAVAVLFLGVLLFSVFRVYRLREELVGQLAWWEIQGYATDPVLIMLPLIVGAAVGTSVADDRRTGFAQLIFARPVSEVKYVVTRFVAATAVATVGLGTSIGVSALAARSWVSTVNNRGLPEGFPASAAGIGICVTALVVLASAFYVALDISLGMFTTNAFAVIAISFGVHFLPMMLLPDSAGVLRPLADLRVESGGLSLLPMLLFWAVGAALLLCASAVVLHARKVTG